MRGKKAEWTMTADFSQFGKDPEELKVILRDEVEMTPEGNKKDYLCSSAKIQ